MLVGEEEPIEQCDHDETITSESHSHTNEDLQRMLSEALEQLYDRERELVLAAEIGQNLLQENVILHQRIKESEKDSFGFHMSPKETSLFKSETGEDLDKETTHENEQDTIQESQSLVLIDHLRLQTMSSHASRQDTSFAYVEELERVNVQLEHQIAIYHRSQSFATSRIDKLEHELDEARVALSLVREDYQALLKENNRFKRQLKHMELEQAMASASFSQLDEDANHPSDSLEMKENDCALPPTRLSSELEVLVHKVSQENEELLQTRDLCMELDRINKMQQSQIQELLCQLENARTEIDELRSQVTSLENLRPMNGLVSPFVFDRVTAMSSKKDFPARTSLDSTKTTLFRKDSLRNASMPSTPLSRKPTKPSLRTLPAKNILLEDSPDRTTSTDLANESDDDVFFTPTKPLQSPLFTADSQSRSTSVSKWSNSSRPRQSPLLRVDARSDSDRPIEMSSISPVHNHYSEDDDPYRLFENPVEVPTAGSALVNLVSRQWDKLIKILPLSPRSKTNSASNVSLPGI